MQSSNASSNSVDTLYNLVHNTNMDNKQKEAKMGDNLFYSKAGRDELANLLQEMLEDRGSDWKEAYTQAELAYCKGRAALVRAIEDLA